MHPIRLSEKAWNYVESRHGDMLPDDYVSMLIENIIDLSSQGQMMPDGMLISDVLEAYRPVSETAGGQVSETATQIMGYLREAYHGKVPRDIYRKKCEGRGLSRFEVEQAEKAFKLWLV